MADSAGELTFSFGADFSGFTREVDGAGKRLDALRAAAARSAAGLATARPLDLGGAMSRAQAALQGGRGSASPASGDGGDDAAARTLQRLTDQLALLQSTGPPMMRSRPACGSRPSRPSWARMQPPPRNSRSRPL